MLGISPESAIENVLLNDAPKSLSELKISGADVAAIGLCGKEIGKMLDYLFYLTLDAPELNKKESLILLAKEKFENEKGNKNARD